LFLFVFGLVFQAFNLFAELCSGLLSTILLIFEVSFELGLVLLDLCGLVLLSLVESFQFLVFKLFLLFVLLEAVEGAREDEPGLRLLSSFLFLLFCELTGKICRFLSFFLKGLIKTLRMSLLFLLFRVQMLNFSVESFFGNFCFLNFELSVGKDLRLVLETALKFFLCVFLSLNLLGEFGNRSFVVFNHPLEELDTLLISIKLFAGAFEFIFD